MDWQKALRRSLEEPGLALRTALALLRGHYCRWKFRLLGRRFRAGRFFQVSGPFEIRGPGTVSFGDNCTVLSTRLRPTTAYTHAPDAVIRFGDRVLLTRTRLGCQSRIEVGDDAGLAEAWLIDTDFHSVKPVEEGQRYNSAGVTKPIVIGRNAWIGQAAMVLKGVRIGENSVVGAGAVVATNVPPDTVVFGNPARVVWRTRRRTAPGSHSAGDAPSPPTE